ncbi:uracil-DNA glycosylase [Mycoplasma corogypsi]|uniref:uracil-DNA glycosylase n=1 Tax=Mycoplasma corogypsi TaxID=2106 RepID=UPI0038730999
MKDSFLNILRREGQKPYFEQILSNLKTCPNDLSIYPHQVDMFRAFEFFQVEQTKVIIIGQDPYHTEGVADGLAFSTRSNKTPPSLKNMFKELLKDYPKTKIETNSLVDWAKQGVLLLNTVLTVEQGKPNSHQKFGWQTFTRSVLDEVCYQNPNVILVLLGKKAQQFAKGVKLDPHNIIAIAHPSPFSYRHGFENSSLFKLINQKLKKQGQQPIKWDLLK